MITKRWKGYVSYLYTWIKYKSITVYNENETGGGTLAIVSKGSLHYKYVSK